MDTSKILVMVISSKSTFHHRLNSILINQSINVIHTFDITSFWEVFPEAPAVIIFIDGNLLHKKEINTCLQLRKEYKQYIVVLPDSKPGYLSESDILNYGADYVLSQQNSDSVLLANIQAILRRNFSDNKFLEEKGSTTLIVQDLIININTYQLMQANKAVKLTSGEMQLLILLGENIGAVVSRDDLFLKLNGTSYSGQSRSLDLRISSLRQKLRDTKPPYQYIKTIRGKGYLLVP